MAELVNEENEQLVRKQLEKSLAGVEVKRRLLSHQMTSYGELKSRIAEKGLASVMVMLGDGYFVDMPAEQALGFLDRRIQHIQATIDGLSANINQGRATLENFAKFTQMTEDKGEKVNEEGLPFVEIREEIDDSGNVVSATLAPSMDSNSQTKNQISDQKISDQKISDQKISNQKISDQKISDQKISDNQIPSDEKVISDNQISSDEKVMPNNQISSDEKVMSNNQKISSDEKDNQNISSDEKQISDNQNISSDKKVTSDNQKSSSDEKTPSSILENEKAPLSKVNDEKLILKDEKAPSSISNNDQAPSSTSQEDNPALQQAIQSTDKITATTDDESQPPNNQHASGKNPDSDKIFNITEKLDEHGNVIDFSLQQDESNDDEKIEEINDENLPNDQHSHTDDLDQINELFEDMGIISNKSIKAEIESMSQTHVVDQDELLNKIDALDIDPQDKFNLKALCVQEYANLKAVDNSPGEALHKTEEEPEEISNGDSNEVISQIIRENNLENVLDQDQPSSSSQIGMTSTPKSHGLAVNENDLIELEVLASELNDDDNVDFYEKNDEDEEWDFEFDDEEGDDDDDDDDYADELLYGNGLTRFIPEATGEQQHEDLNEKLWNQVARLRQSKSQSKTPHEPSDQEQPTVVIQDEKVIKEFKSILKDPSSRTGGKITKGTQSATSGEGKKAVRFNDKLEINEIQNVSEELRQIQHHNQNLSRFKQNRLLSKGNSINDSNSFGSTLNADDFENPLSALVVERNFDDDDDVDIGEDEVYDSDSFSLDVDEAAPHFDSFDDEDDDNNIESKTNKHHIIGAPILANKIAVRDEYELQEDTLDRPNLLSRSILEHEDKVEPVLGDVVDREDTSVTNVTAPTGDSTKISKFKARLLAHREKENGNTQESRLGETDAANEKKDVTSSNATQQQADAKATEGSQPRISKFKAASLAKREQEPKLSYISENTVSDEVQPISKDDSSAKKDVQNNSEDSTTVKQDPQPTKISKFKAAALAKKEAALSDVKESSNSDATDAVSTAANDTTQAPMSRFRTELLAKREQAKSLKSITKSTEDISSDQRGEVIERIETMAQPPQVKSVRQNADGNHDQAESTPVNDVNVDFASMQQDMDTMAKAYVLGMYDDDIMTEGPVVDKLDDFEVLNRMVESMDNEDKTKKLKDQKQRIAQRRRELKMKNANQYDEKLDAVGVEFNDDDNDEEAGLLETMDAEEDGGVMTDEIVENEVNDIPDSETIEQDMLNQEVKDQYNRMRQKMIYDNAGGYQKDDAELEFEVEPPVDDDGRPIRISRFRQKRLGLTS